MPDGAIWLADQPGRGKGVGQPPSKVYPYKSGMYLFASKSTTGFTPANDVVNLSPFPLLEDTLVSGLVSRIIATMTAGTYRVVLYDSDNNGLPNNPLESSTAISATALPGSPGTIYTFAANRLLRAGLYYVGFVCTGASTFTNTVQGCILSDPIMPDAGVGASRFGWTFALGSGAAFPTAPAVTSGGAFGSAAPMIGLVLP